MSNVRRFKGVRTHGSGLRAYCRGSVQWDYGVRSVDTSLRLSVGLSATSQGRVVMRSMFRRCFFPRFGAFWFQDFIRFSYGSGPRNIEETSKKHRRNMDETSKKHRFDFSINSPNHKIPKEINSLKFWSIDYRRLEYRSWPLEYRSWPLEYRLQAFGV
jgi:hypothetical protein